MINKTFIERLEETTTWDRMLEQEIYLQLYREDLLRIHSKTNADVDEVAVFRSGDKVKTFAGARSEDEHFDDYPPYSLSAQVWILLKDGSSLKASVPMFSYDFGSALKLVPKDMNWAAGHEPEQERPFWFALGEEASVHHVSLALACVQACVRHKIENWENVPS